MSQCASSVMAGQARGPYTDVGCMCQNKLAHLWIQYSSYCGVGANKSYKNGLFSLHVHKPLN